MSRSRSGRVPAKLMLTSEFENRNYPNNDPRLEGGAAEPTYEVYPPTPGFVPQDVNFVVNTSGLNSYPHMFLMPSGKFFVQANYSTST